MSNQKKMAGGVSRSPNVRCPTCKEKLKEILYVPVYRCPKCNTVFLANSWKGDKGVRNLDKHVMVSHKKDVPKQKEENTDRASKDESIHGNNEPSSSSTNVKDIGSKSCENNISEKCIENSSATLNNELMSVRKNVDVVSESTGNISNQDIPKNDSNNCEIMLGDRMMAMGMETDHLAFNDDSICISQETASCSRDMNIIESGSYQKNVSENLSKSSFCLLNDASMSQKSNVDSCLKYTSEVEDNSTQDSPGNGSINCEVEPDKRMMPIGKEAIPHQKEKVSSQKSLLSNDSVDGEPLYFSQSEIVSCKITITETEIMSSYDNAVVNDSEACWRTLDDGLISQNEEVPFAYKCMSTTGSEKIENISILSEKNIVGSGSEDNKPTLNQELEGPKCISSQKCLPDDGSENSQHALNGASLIASVEASFCTEDAPKLDSISSESNLIHSENHESSSKEDPVVFAMRISPTISEVRGSENMSFQNNTSIKLLQNEADVLPEMVLDKETAKCATDGGAHENLDVSKNESCKFAGNDGLTSRRTEVAPSSTYTSEFESIQSEKYKVDSCAEKRVILLKRDSVFASLEAFPSSKDLEYLPENVTMDKESQSISTQKNSPENYFENGVAMDGEINSASIKSADCTIHLMENKNFLSETKHIVSDSELENFNFLLDESIPSSMEASHRTVNSKGFDIVSNVSVCHSDNSEHIFENMLHLISKESDPENILVDDNQKDLLVTSDGMMSVGMEEAVPSSTIANKHNSISSIENVEESDNEEHGFFGGTTSEAVMLRREVSGSSISMTNCEGILLGENISAIESEICGPSLNNEMMAPSKEIRDISYKNNMQQNFLENSEIRIADRLISANVEDASPTTETETPGSIPSQSLTSQNALENFGFLVNEESKLYVESSPFTTKGIEMYSVPTHSRRSESFLENLDPKFVDEFSLVEKEIGPKLNESFLLEKRKPKIVKEDGTYPVSVRKNYSSSSYMRRRISSPNYMDMSSLENDRPSLNCESVQKNMKISHSSTDVIELDSLLSMSNQTENELKNKGSMISFEMLSTNEEIECISGQYEALNTDFEKEEHEESNELNCSSIKGAAINSDPSTSVFTENGIGKDDALVADEPEAFSSKLSPSKEVMRPETVSVMSSMYVNDLETSKDTELAANRKESTTMLKNSSQSVEEDKVLQIDLMLETALLSADNSTHDSTQLFDNNTGLVSVSMKYDSSLEEIHDQEAILSQVISSDNYNDGSEFLSDDKSLLQDMDTSFSADSKDTKNKSTWGEASESTWDNSFLNCTNDVKAAEIESHYFCTASKNDTILLKAYVPESGLESKLNDVLLCVGQNANSLKDAEDSDSISSENTISECSTSKDSLDHGLLQDDVFGKVGQSIIDESKCKGQEIDLILSQNSVVKKDTENSEFAGNDESSSLNKDMETYLFGMSIMFMAAGKDNGKSESFQGFHEIADGKSVCSVTEQNDEFLNISYDDKEDLGSCDQKNFPEKDMDRKVDITGQEEVNSQNGSNDATMFSVGNSNAYDQHIGRDSTRDQLSSPVRTLRSLRSLIKSESVVIKDVHKREASTVNMTVVPQIEVFQESTRASTIPKVRRSQQIIGNHNFPPNKSYDLNILSQAQVERGEKDVNLGSLSEDRNLHDNSRSNINFKALPKGLNPHEMSTDSNKVPHPSEKVNFPKPLHIDVPRKVDLLRNQQTGPLEQTYEERRSSLYRGAWRRRAQTHQSNPQSGQVFLNPSTPQHPNTTSRQRETMSGIHKFNNASETSSPSYFHRRSHHHLQSSAQFQQNQRPYTKYSPHRSQKTGENGHEMQKANAQARRQTIKLHLRPILGGLQYIICYECLELLQVPQDFHFAGKRENKLQCGACSKVLKFSLDGNHISPFIANQRLPSSG